MAAGDGAQLPAAVAASRSVDKALEEAAGGGALHLANRKLREFPRSAGNYDLSDITLADLSKNRLCEFPEELCQFISLETLSLYHNGMRSLSSSLDNLQALTYLNLSRNLLSSLPPSLFQLPLLRVLVVSNNKLSLLPAAVSSLTNLRQLDVSCNELQCLPAELGHLESLRDLNLRRNQLTVLPEEISELPLVRLDVACNRISRLPLCYRHLRHLQSISLDSNPLQMPPAQICSKGKYHIFKYLNMEACRRNQEELETHLRPTGFNSCLLDQDLFSVPLGGLDSGFNSVDSGSKRWSGNESTEEFSERSLRLAELNRDQRNPEVEEGEGSVHPAHRGEGTPQSAAVCDVIKQAVSCSVMDRSSSTALPVVRPVTTATTPPQPIGANSCYHGNVMTDLSLSPPPEKDPPPSQSQAESRSGLHVDLDAPSPVSLSPVSPSSPSPEERRRPGTLLIWQERERLQQQREKASVLKSTTKSGSHVTSGVTSGGEDSDCSLGLRQRSASAEPLRSMSTSPSPLHRSTSRTDTVSKTSPPPGSAHKPNSFLFRTSSRSSVKPTVFTLGESGRSESRMTLRSPKEERPDVAQLRKTLESRLKISLPEDLGEALSNGIVLCQLANHIRPRAVSIIHVPSPAVPKLSLAKCRLNVENFLVACRRLGVAERDVCVCPDVFLSKLPALLRCVTALLAVETPPPRQAPPSPLLSADFLLFYCVAMALLYALYRGVLG